MAKRYVEENNKSSKSKIGNSILNIMLMIFLILLVISLVQIINWYKNNRENAKVVEEIATSITVEEKEEGKEYSVDFNTLKEKNSDTIAWLKVNGTNIEFAVVQGTNNDYYLNRNFNKEYNIAGWIFADYRNKFDGTDKNIIVYGHNMRDDSMFGTLKNVIKEEWYNNEENYKVTFITENEKSVYEVFSVYQVETEDYYIQTDFASETKYNKFLDTIKNRSVKDFNVEVTTDDNILTLSTCANNNKYRVVLHAKKI